MLCCLFCQPREEFHWSLDHLLAMASDLAITKIDELALSHDCKLNYNHNSTSSIRLRVGHMNITQSLTIRSLMTLFNCLDVDDLSFSFGCKIHGISGYIPGPPEVSSPISLLKN